MIIVNDLTQALFMVEKETNLTLIIEEVRLGLEMKIDQPSQLLTDELSKLYQKCGRSLKFRLFNNEIDINWRGRYGIIVKEKANESKAINLFLESDLKRHPGMLAFQERLGDLKEYCLKAQIIDNGTYLRFVSIVKDGGNNEFQTD